MKRALCLLAMAFALAPVGAVTPAGGQAHFNPAPTKNVISLDSYEVKTLYDLGSPDYSAGASLYSEGTLTYVNSGSTIGYSLQNPDILVESDIEFTNSFEWPSWFSITFRASGFDRTQSGNLEQKGYSYLIRPSGEIIVYKNGVVLGNYASPLDFPVGTKRTIVYGAVEEENAIRLILLVDGQEALNHLDETDPLNDGNSCFYFCGDGTVSAVLTSKNTPVPEPLGDFPFDEHETISLTDLSSPLIAGTGTYYEDGLLHYGNSGCTAGWYLPNPDNIMEFDVTFTNQFDAPAWLSINVRASGFDRTHAAALENLGYVLIINPSGDISLSKNRTAVAAGSGSPLLIHTKYNFKVAAIEYEQGIRVALFVNDVAYIDYYDQTDALLTSGNYFNICGDWGGKNLSADFLSTKESYVPPYTTYTLANIGRYPLRAGTPRADVDVHTNAITFANTSQTVGFEQGLQNFSLGAYYYLPKIAEFSNFWISLRAKGFARATDSSVGGYSIRLGQTGVVEIYKQGGTNGGLIGGGGFGFVEGETYYIELGAVDYNETKTMVFVSANNRVIAQAFDETEPYQNAGWVNFTPDGAFFPRISSGNDVITPLRHKAKPGENKTDYCVYLNNAFASHDMAHGEFDERVMKSIEINGQDIVSLNANYHALEDEEPVPAIKLSTYANQFIISVASKLYDGDGNEVPFTPSKITIRKTSGSRGFVTPNGYILKNTYTFDA